MRSARTVWAWFESLAFVTTSPAAMSSSIETGGDGIIGDRHFHRAVAGAAHNELLAQLHDQLRELIDRTSEASLTRPGRPPVSLHEHQEIFEAIEGARAGETVQFNGRDLTVEAVA